MIIYHTGIWLFVEIQTNDPCFTQQPPAHAMASSCSSLIIHWVLCRHEKGTVDGRWTEVDDPFISGRAAGGGGMTIALMDDVVDLLAELCSSETVLIILLTVAFAVYIELFCIPLLHAVY